MQSKLKTVLVGLVFSLTAALVMAGEPAPGEGGNNTGNTSGGYSAPACKEELNDLNKCESRFGVGSSRCKSLHDAYLQCRSAAR